MVAKRGGEYVTSHCIDREAEVEGYYVICPVHVTIQRWNLNTNYNMLDSKTCALYPYSLLLNSS